MRMFARNYHRVSARATTHYLSTALLVEISDCSMVILFETVQYLEGLWTWGRRCNAQMQGAVAIAHVTEDFH